MPEKVNIEMPSVVRVVLGNIVKQPDCDAIVNSANRNLRSGSGVCGAIHAAAGPELEAFSHPLSPLDLGEAVSTPGFRLPNRIVVHVRGPQYLFDLSPARYLSLAMRNVLRLADQEGVVRIAVPGISMGVYAYPPREAIPILIQTVYETLEHLDHIREVRFVVIDKAIKELFEAEIAEWEFGQEPDTNATEQVTGRLITPKLVAAIRKQYRLSWAGIHGARHWARVRKNGLLIAEVTGARTDVVELFSFLHDSCRQNDGRDPDHGRRAVEFATRLRGDCFELDDAGFELLCEAMTFHSDGFTDAPATVQACWDADRLDLVRIDIQPTPDRLCTDAARRLLTLRPMKSA
jgi:O-acetyl-ADP-ribose deacetylase (regulator of RNase III)